MDTPHTQTPHAHEKAVQRRDDARFQNDLQTLLKSAEDTRLRLMHKKRFRSNMALALGLTSLLVGGCGFGWLFLMQAKLWLGLAVLVASALPYFVFDIWAKIPPKTYAKQYKTDFLPQMANLLGGFRYFPKRGVSGKIIKKAGFLKPFEHYDAEDCFAGTYKGVKIIWSEARLYADQRKKEQNFDGVFVLLEIPEDMIEGHTILTADHKLAEAWEHSRWQQLTRFEVEVSNPHWARFHMFSNKPEGAKLFVGERFLKELSEAADIFDEAPLSAALFGHKYIFIAIPYAENMFEASHLEAPIPSSRHSMKCKKEIEQILEIIDVYDLYKTSIN